MWQWMVYCSKLYRIVFMQVGGEDVVKCLLDMVRETWCIRANASCRYRVTHVHPSQSGAVASCSCVMHVNSYSGLISRTFADVVARV